MDASRPEADPVEIGYSTREVDQSQAATKVNATKRAILSTSAEPFSAATAVEKSSVQTPQKEAHHALDTPRTLAQCMAASSDLQATTSIETQVLQNDTASTHKVQDGAKGILNTSATSNSCVAASTDIQATMSIEEQIVQYNKATNLEGESSKAPKFSPLKPEYDEDGNYIPPHLRKHKRQLKKEDDEIGNRTPTRVKNQHQSGPGHSPGSPGTMKPESVATKSPVSTAAAMNQGALSAPTVATGAPRQELDFSVMKEHGEIENQTSPRVRIQHQSSPDHDLGSPGTMRPEPKSSASTAAAAVQGMRHGPAVVTGAPHQDFESSGEINPESVAVESSDLKGTTVIQNLSDDSIFATSPPQQDLESPGEIKPEPIVVRISSWKATDVVRDTPHVSAEMAAGTHGQAEKDTNETVNKASGSSPHTPGKYTILQKTDPSPGTASRSTPSRFKKPRRQSPWARAALPRKHISGDGSDAWDNKRVIASDDMNLADSNGWRRELENDDDERRLQDWDGKWMPAPVEWDARPAFNNTGAKFAESVDMWVKQRASEAVVQVNVEDSGFKDGLAIATGTDEIYEIIPRGEEGDTKLYPEDDYTATKLVQTSYSSSLALLAKTQTEQKDRQLDRKAKRTVSKVYRETYVAPPNDYIPKANIYIRPATVGDIAQIKDIYAWYISNTVVATERDQLDYASWRSRMQDIEDCKLPFLVAVTKSGRNNRRHVTYAEKIVGFGFADLFAGQFDAFKYAVEMQVFVHHHHKKVGVGMTLVDRLVAALDPLYMSRNGTDFFADNALDYEQGGRRIAGKILVTITYDANNDRDFQWQKKWLAEWDFEHVATLPRLGYKFDKLYVLF